MPRQLARIWPICLGALALACASADKEGGGYGYTDGNGTAGPGLTGEGTGTSADPTAGEVPPPEAEDEGDFRVPKASGKYVYSASETTDSVAVINTATLVIDVVAVGQGPTVVQPIPGQPGDAGSVVVLDQGSDDIAVLRTDEAGATTRTIYKVTPGANNLAVAPGGKYVFAYHDVDAPEALGGGSDQELTVLDLAGGVTHRMTVGAHPREVVFATDDSAAWVITAAGVNVITFAALGDVGKPPLLPVVADPGIDPATLEVQIAASEGIALARVDGEPWLAITQLPGGELTVLDLPGVPTDLDIAASGQFAVLTLPSASGSSFLELPLPLGPGQYTQHPVAGEYVGLANIANSGDTMLLYTTVNPFAFTIDPTPAQALVDYAPAYNSSSTGDGTTTTGEPDDTTGDLPDIPHADPRQRITLARRDGAGWDLVTLFVDLPITSAGVAPDSRSAVLVHGLDSDPGNSGAPYAYSLFDLAPKFPLLKRQNTQAAPGTILFTPQGDRAAVLLRDDVTEIRKVDLVDLGNFIVKPLLLGSPPEGAGHVDATGKIFVSQAHPTGRITFIGAAGDVQTVTGYVLNDSVKD